MYAPELVTAAMQERERAVARLLGTRRNEPIASSRSGPFTSGGRAIYSSLSRIACATGFRRAAPKARL